MKRYVWPMSTNSLHNFSAGLNNNNDYIIIVVVVVNIILYYPVSLFRRLE